MVRTTSGSLLCIATLVIVGVLPLPALGESPPPSVPVREWLRGPDRQDIVWKIEVFQNLTLQQRHLVQVLATIRGGDYLDAVSLRDLHIVTKVANDRGNWLDGQSYTHFAQPANFSRSDRVHVFANLYLRPGSYTIAMIAYDSLHGVGNVWRTQLIVPPVAKPLAGLDRGFPSVEFLPPAEAALRVDSAGWDSYRDVLEGRMLDPLSLGHGTAHLPVANKKPVRIDVIVNLSDNIEDSGRLFGLPGARPRSDFPGVLDPPALSAGDCYPFPACVYWFYSRENSTAYKYDEGLALQVGNLVSQLAPASGCVRFSALDVLRQDLIVDRVDARKMDWDDLSERIATKELSTINVTALREKEAALWLKRFIEHVGDDGYACGLHGGADHVLIFVSLAMAFSSQTEIKTVESGLPLSRSYHLEMRFKGLPAGWDQTDRVLRPIKPKILRFIGADQLRGKLDFIVKDLEASLR